MCTFLIRVAGRTAAVTTPRESTRLFCGGYISNGRPDFALEVTQEDLSFEQAENTRLRLDAGEDAGAYLEIVALLRKLAEKLVEYDTLLFHGSVVAVDGVGYLFAAPSGTGKSTHTRLWRELLGSRAVMVNDDKPFLEITPSGVVAHGSPWNGKHRLDTNISVPLRAICVLERGGENRITRITAQEALVTLFRQCYRPRYQAARYMELLDRLAGHVAFYRLCCNMSPDAAAVAYDAMTNETQNQENPR